MMQAALPERMAGVHLTGHGGLDKLVYRIDLSVPRPRAGEVLIKVRAAAVNNTDINTRTGWYSRAVRGETNAGGAQGFDETNAGDATWSGRPLEFPRIQGADCFGEIVVVGEGVPEARVGERVLVRTMLRAPVGFRPYDCWTFGSECDGGFAEYAVAPAADVFRVDSALSDGELGAIACAYSTAEGMLQRAGVSGSDRVLILGASGGVGSAAVQLAKLRGAEVIAVASPGKAEAVHRLGADRIVPRGDSLLNHLGAEAVSVIVDLVAGPGFEDVPELLQRGGRYVTAGAIAGPMVRFDLRRLYLKDLSFFGCAAQGDSVFQAIIGYLDAGRLRPPVAATFPLCEIRAAQEMFLEKSFTGKIVLLP